MDSSLSKDLLRSIYKMDYNFFGINNISLESMLPAKENLDKELSIFLLPAKAKPQTNTPNFRIVTISKKAFKIDMSGFSKLLMNKKQKEQLSKSEYVSISYYEICPQNYAIEKQALFDIPKDELSFLQKNDSTFSSNIESLLNECLMGKYAHPYFMEMLLFKKITRQDKVNYVLQKRMIQNNLFLLSQLKGVSSNFYTVFETYELTDSTLSSINYKDYKKFRIQSYLEP